MPHTILWLCSKPVRWTRRCMRMSGRLPHRRSRGHSGMQQSTWRSVARSARTCSAGRTSPTSIRGLHSCTRMQEGPAQVRTHQHLCHQAAHAGAPQVARCRCSLSANHSAIAYVRRQHHYPSLQQSVSASSCSPTTSQLHHCGHAGSSPHPPTSPPPGSSHHTYLPATPPTGADALARAARALEEKEPKTSYDLYVQAIDMYETDGKEGQAADVFRSAIGMLCKKQDLPNAATLLLQFGAVCDKTNSRSTQCKCYLGEALQVLPCCFWRSCTGAHAADPESPTAAGSRQPGSVQHCMP